MRLKLNSLVDASVDNLNQNLQVASLSKVKIEVARLNADVITRFCDRGDGRPEERKGSEGEKGGEWSGQTEDQRGQMNLVEARGL